MEHPHPPAGSIVVGVDGSSSSNQALEWAAAHAALERRPLVVLHATDVLGPGQAAWPVGSGPDPAPMTEAMQTASRGLLATATSRARRLAPGMEVHEVRSLADPRNALLAAARDASTVVIGSRGRGPVASLLRGSVSVAVSKHAGCPVVVVRPHAAGAKREGVLVGIDGTAQDRDVVEFALRLASLGGLPLTVIHSFWDVTHLGGDDHVVAADECGVDDTRSLLDQAVRETAGLFPDVEIHVELARGFADRQLIERATTMDIVVVGSRRSAGIGDLGIGALAPTVVEHARCTVAVVPFVVSDRGVQLARSRSRGDAEATKVPTIRLQSSWASTAGKWPTPSKHV